MDRINRSVAIRFAFFALVALILAVPAQAGWTYEARTTTDSDQGQDSTMVVKGWVEGEAGRVEFEQVSGPQAQMFGDDEGYLITKDGGATIYLVDPEERTYTEFDLSALFSSLGQMMEAMGGMVDIDFSDAEVELLSKESGPGMLGHDTTHYRWRSAYVFEISVMGFQQRNEVDTITDTWVTDDLADAGYQAWLRKSPPTTGDEDLDAMIRAEAAKMAGFPLKTVSVTKTKDKKGRESTSTTTTEVTTLEETNVPADRFEIPSGYERVEMAAPQR